MLLLLRVTSVGPTLWDSRQQLTCLSWFSCKRTLRAATSPMAEQKWKWAAQLCPTPVTSWGWPICQEQCMALSRCSIAICLEIINAILYVGRLNAHNKNQRNLSQCANYNQTLKLFTIYIYIYAFPNSLFFLFKLLFPTFFGHILLLWNECFVTSCQIHMLKP